MIFFTNFFEFSLKFPCSDVVCETARSRLIRDFLLVNLHENEFVKRQEFQQSVKLPPEAVETLLSKVAISTPNGWKLKLGPDSDFMNKYKKIPRNFHTYIYIFH